MYLDLLMKSLKTKFDSEEREGVHVSDLTLCLRKAIFRKLNQTSITPKELNFCTLGRAIKDAIQTLANYTNVKTEDAIKDMKFGYLNIIKNKFEIEKEIEFQGISGHID